MINPPGFCMIWLMPRGLVGVHRRGHSRANIEGQLIALRIFLPHLPLDYMELRLLIIYHHHLHLMAWTLLLARCLGYSLWLSASPSLYYCSTSFTSIANLRLPNLRNSPPESSKECMKSTRLKISVKALLAPRTSKYRISQTQTWKPWRIHQNRISGVQCHYSLCATNTRTRRVTLGIRK